MTAPTDPAAPPRPAATVPARPARRWPSRVLAAASVVLFAAGALRIGAWLRERRELAEHVASPRRRDAATAAPAIVPADPRMAAYLPATVRFGPVRRMPFGRDEAYFAAGPSRTPPGTVFGEILRRFEPASDPASLRRAIEQGPSALAGLRTAPTIGKFPGGVSLVHLPASSAAAERAGPDADVERLATEPGGVVLAFDYGDRFEYAVFFFPSGLDVEAFTRAATPRPDALAALGPEAVDALSPELRLGADGRGELVTTLCRAKGPAGAAMERVAKGLARQGYKELAGVRPSEDGADADVVRVLEGPRGTIWLTTSEREVDGGLVTVTMTAL